MYFFNFRTKHRELKTSYNSLHKKATSGVGSQEFQNSKVANLWRLALRADFDEKELESLHVSLLNYIITNATTSKAIRKI